MTPYEQALARIEHNQKHNTGWLDDNDFTEGKVNPFYAALKAVLELHTTFGIYDECGHDHTDEEADDPNSDVLFINEIGNTCKSALLYYVCKECCIDDPDECNLTEECSDHHLHTEVKGWICNSADLIIKGVLGG